MNKGTVSDKIAAFVVAIQNNPMYSIEQLRQLISMVKVSKKKECTAVIGISLSTNSCGQHQHNGIFIADSLTELFVTSLLKRNEKLKSFHERPLSLLDELSSGNAITRKKYLCNWYFESELKEAFASFVIALNGVSHDTVEANKEKAVGAMYKLLHGTQEQEKVNVSTYI